MYGSDYLTAVSSEKELRIHAKYVAAALTKGESCGGKIDIKESVLDVPLLNSFLIVNLANMLCAFDVYF